MESIITLSVRRRFCWQDELVTVFIMQDNPKHSEKGLDFDPDGSFMAVIHRKNFKDAVKLYSCRTWDVVNVRPAH